MSILIASGVGAFAAGLGLAGHDPEPEPTAPVEQTRVAAVDFDPYQRVYVRNDDLSMQATTPAIQRAAHLMLPLNALPAVPSSGIDIASIKRASLERRLTVVIDALNRTWRVLLDAGLIAIRTVEIDPSEPWNGRFYADVEDLQTGRPFRLASTPQR
jgi:hypothetical protein